MQNLFRCICKDTSLFEEVYAEIVKRSGQEAASSAELYSSIKEEVPYITRYQFVFATEVLEELGIVKFENGRMKYDRTVRSDLSSSEIFNKMGGRK